MKKKWLNWKVIATVVALVLIVAVGTFFDYSQFIIFTTPEKIPKQAESRLTQQAESRFWSTLYNGRFDDLTAVINLLTAAYLQNPHDPRLSAHLGFAYIWKLTERQRLGKIEPTIINNIVLSKAFFKDAVQLNPSDARYLGFLGDAELVEGKIFNDERTQTRGYFTIKDAISIWPEFNYFAGGFVMSALPSQSQAFKEGLDWQWRTLDLCANTKIDRQNPDFSPYMKLETNIRPKSACWNSEIAPFNFEGFFLNMGDMLVKAGELEKAIIIYNNAKLDKNYNHWPYKFLLENHLKFAKENVGYFNQDNELNFNSTKAADKSSRDSHVIVFNSGYGCMMCHQSRK